jgi:tRNA (adenine37-N6)-methyltransferase
MVVCDGCGTSCDREACFVVDGEQLCHRCLFGDVSPVAIYPIGLVSNSQQEATHDFRIRARSLVSTIELFPSQESFLYRLDEEEAITVVYYLHKSGPVKSRFNRGYDGKEVGVFASRTPYRLSKIGIQSVRLLQVEGTTLTVEGLDAINGTPVLDIKMKWP